MAKMIHPIWPLKIMNQLQAGDDFFGSMRCSSLYEGKPELRKVGSIEIQTGNCLVRSVNATCAMPPKQRSMKGVKD